MITSSEVRLSIGINQEEINEAEQLGEHVLYGAETIRLMPSDLTPDRQISAKRLLDDPDLRAKALAIGSRGLYATLSSEGDITLFADIERLRDPEFCGQVYVLPPEAIFTDFQSPANRRYPQIAIHVTAP